MLFPTLYLQHISWLYGMNKYQQPDLHKSQYKILSWDPQDFSKPVTYQLMPGIEQNQTKKANQEREGYPLSQWKKEKSKYFKLNAIYCLTGNCRVFSNYFFSTITFHKPTQSSPHKTVLLVFFLLSLLTAVCPYDQLKH